MIPMILIFIIRGRIFMHKKIVKYAFGLTNIMQLILSNMPKNILYTIGKKKKKIINAF